MTVLTGLRPCMLFKCFYLYLYLRPCTDQMFLFVLVPQALHAVQMFLFVPIPQALHAVQMFPFVPIPQAPHTVQMFPFVPIPQALHAVQMFPFVPIPQAPHCSNVSICTYTLGPACCSNEKRCKIWRCHSRGHHDEGWSCGCLS